MAHNAWDEATKMEALDAYVEHGLSAASRATGVPSGTIKRWAWENDLGGQRRQAFLESKIAKATATQDETAERERLHREYLTESEMRQQRKRMELREMLLDRAVEALHRMDDPHIDFRGKDAIEVEYPKPDAASLRNYAITAATLLDKWRLEMGEATDRTEHLTLSEVEAEIRRLEAMANGGR